MIREGKAEGWLRLPITALQPWASLNDVQFNGVNVAPQVGREDRGCTVVARQKLVDGSGFAAVMTVPRDLILSLERVNEHAKYDQDFRNVLEAIGEFGTTTRGAILTFLLMQCSTACPSMPAKHGLTSAFTDYIKFLPLELLPTFWTAAERSLLTGTTLAPAVTSKLNSLYREYDNVRASTSNIAWCAESWWHDVDGHVGFDDWLQVDAMYRSRALEFPGIGDCMAPCIDMANHVDGDLTAAVYEVDAEGNAVLLLRDGKTVEEGDEVSITYGDAKGACEMVFSYGFLDHDMTSAKELFLDLSFPLDDPLRKAKTLVADTAPGFKVVQTENGISWEGDYVWLVCVNEEDGLEFAIEQTLDGGTELKSFWKQQDLPELGNFKTLLTKDEQWELFHLRAICVLQDRVATQLQTLYRVEDEVNAAEHGEGTAIRERPWQLAMRLRTLEGELLEQAYSHFEDLKVHLAQSDVVQRFLTATENEVVAQPFEADLGTNIDARVEEDDFS